MERDGRRIRKVRLAGGGSAGSIDPAMPGQNDISDDADPLIAARTRRAAQDMAGADACLTTLAVQRPDDPVVAMMLAQVRHERGLPGADLFARAAALDPANPDARRNQALALAAEGDPAAAEAVLTGVLAERPDWLDGLRVLASLRWIAGRSEDFDAAWRDAARARPGVQGLWLGWFSALAQVRDWPRAIAVLDEAQRHCGTSFAILSARIFVAGESGDDATCAALLDRLAGREDDFLRLARIRLELRRGNAVAARDTALAMLGGPGRAQAWSYLSTAWRLLGDPMADWLDGDPAFVRAHDVALGAADLAELAELLRGFHLARAPYAEQSVRLGTQTDRPVLLRHEPIVQRACAALLDCVAQHIAALPPPDPRHPLLAVPRGPVLIAGSWSVRLGAGGFNVAHCHPAGWLSSAFYVALPDPAEAGSPPAGYFHWGAPPTELKVDLPPRGMIAPKVGQIVLFPSYFWHGTVPIERGERLNIAFDIVPRPN